MFNILTKVDKSAQTRRNLHTYTHTSNLLLSPKQIGTICFAIFSFVFSAPSFADPDISSSASTADCKHTPLQVYSGTSNLEANWRANEIYLYWYDGDELLDVPDESLSCIYDGTLTPPATIPTRTGYTFKGWRVRDLTCGLSHVDTSIYADWDADYIAWQPINGSSGYTVAQAIDNGDINPGTDHSSELSNGEWRIIFSYGTVKGMSKCSGLSGDNNGYTWSDPSRATESELTSASGEKKYCWCAATSYTPDGGTQCNIASPSWVFLGGSGSASDCARDCANACALDVDDDYYAVGFHRAVFGVQ